eukprot:Clim_evm91s243 gene=Clim_evmTU91s243
MFRVKEAFKQAEANTNEEKLIVAVHCVLIDSGYGCLGAGNNGTENEPDVHLPEAWNKGEDAQSMIILRYTHENNPQSRKTLQAIRMGSSVLFRFDADGEEKQTGEIEMKAEDYLGEDGHLKDYRDFSGTIQKQLIEPTSLAKNEKNEEATSGSSSNKRKATAPVAQPQSVMPSRAQGPPVAAGDGAGIGNRPDFDYGRPDLDPLGGMGPRAPGYPNIVGPPMPGMGVAPSGGMMFDPFRGGGGVPGAPGGFRPPGGNGQLPPGAVPPGARFDPFGPPGAPGMPGAPGGPNRGGGGGGFGTGRPTPGQGRYANPDPDQLPPPGYNDMFM